MARKVFVSSDMSVDDQLAEVADTDPMAALIWPWLLTTFDDWGRARLSERRLKNKVFPAVDLIDERAIARACALFAEVGLLGIYEVDGRRYMAIEPDKWYKYQTHIRGEKRKVDNSRFPAPPEGLFKRSARDCAQPRATARDCTPSPSPSPSPSPTDDDDADTRARAREATPEPESATRAAVIDAYYRNIEKTLAPRGDMRPMVVEELHRLIDELDGRQYGPELVIEAIREAAGANAKSLKYVSKVVETWRDAGIETPEDLALYREQQAARRQAAVGSGSGRAGPGRRRVPQGMAALAELYEQARADEEGQPP